MLYLTKDEKKGQIKEDDIPQLGLKVTIPSGVVYWIPGSSVEFAWVLATNSAVNEWLEHPQTRIEHGERHRGVFTMKKVIKVPVGGGK